MKFKIINQLSKQCSIFVVALLLSFFTATVTAAGGESIYPNDPANINLRDTASLQRGAQLYMNYCVGCHSLSYQRYNRLGRDLGLTDDEVRDNLIFTTDESGEPTKVGDLIKTAMTNDYARQAFGVVPPDLSLTVRAKGGPDWLYNYLRAFYVDESRPMGVNNGVFANVGMPHVLWPLQGLQRPVYETYTDAEGQSHERIAGYELIEQGSMTPAEYDIAIRDITGFLTYVAEPAKLSRIKTGIYVIIFLLIFAALSYMLKNEYWADVKHKK